MKQGEQQSVDNPWDKGLCIRFGPVNDGLIYEGVTGQGFHIAAQGGSRHVLAKDGLGRLLLMGQSADSPQDKKNEWEGNPLVLLFMPLCLPAGSCSDVPPLRSRSFCCLVPVPAYAALHLPPRPVHPA